MPSGYTHEIYEGTDTTLRGFALRCARGMGALITMRDEPSDAPIPERLTPHTRYYDERIEKLTWELLYHNALTEDEKKVAADQFNADVEATNAKTVAENAARRARYDQMLEKVEAWEGAPEGLKGLMLDQLRQSRDFDTSDDPLAYAAKPKTVDDWFVSKKAELERNLAYAKSQRQAEIERTEKRNEWIAQLWAALPAEGE